jgi:type II secretory pathway pseudopilin PulG
MLEAVLIVVSVMLALAADNWREEVAEQKLERHYLEALADDLRADLENYKSDQEDISLTADNARYLLGVLRSSGTPLQSDKFLVAVESSIRTIEQPPISRGAYDDMVGGGQLGLIRNDNLRRRISDYYALTKSNEYAWELWRYRSWYGFGPVAVAVMPLDAQVWAAATLGQMDSPSAAPIPEDIDGIASEVAEALRADRRTEGLVRAVIRSTWGQASTLASFSSSAEDVLGAVEEELSSRWPDQ